MSLIAEDTLISHVGIRQTKESDPVGISDTAPTPATPRRGLLRAAFEQHNTIASFLTFGVKDKFKTNQLFNPLDHIEGTNLEPRDVIYADSIEDIQELQAQKSREIENLQIIQQAGFSGTLASIGAATLDPTLVIGGGIGLGAKAAAIAPRVVRAAIGAGQGAAIAGGSIGIQEAILKNTTLTKTTKEALINTAFGSILGAGLGSAIGLLSVPSRKALVQALKEVDSAAEELPSIVASRSIGAAERSLEQQLVDDGLVFLNIQKLQKIKNSLKKGSDEYALIDAELQKSHRAVGEKIFKILSSPILQSDQLRSPLIVGSTSEFPSIRALTANAFESNFNTGKTVHGIATRAAESDMKHGQGIAHSLASKQRDAYLTYINTSPSAGVIRGSLAQQRAIKEGLLSEAQFDEEIAKAMSKGDRHSIPAVEAVAKANRKAIDDITKEMQELGILKDDLSTKFAKSYFPRRYNVAKIISNRGKFEETLTNHLMKGDGLHAPLDKLEAQAKALDIVDSIIGEGDLSLGLSASFMRAATKSGSFTKERVLSLSDEELEPWLVKSAKDVITPYLVRAHSLVAFNKMLQRLGHSGTQDLKVALRLEKDQLITKFPEKTAKLEKEFKKSTQFVDDITDILLGNIRKRTSASPYLRVLRQYTTMAKLGGVLISSMLDMAQPIFVHGPVRTLLNGYIPMIRSLVLANKKGWRAEVKELKDYRVAVELESNTILKALVDGESSIGIGRSKFDRILDDAMHIYGKATGLSYWNVANKRLAARITTARSMRALLDWEKSGSMSVADTTRLARLGIGSDMYERILAQYHRFGYIETGTPISNFSMWADKEAANIYASHIGQEVDATVITPGLGDIPLAIQKSDVGATIFQFKSFIASATNKLLLAGLQRRDADTIIGVLSLMGLGYIKYTISSSIAGKEIKSDWSTFVNEGLSNSGLLGLFGDYVLSLNPYTKPSRFASQNSPQTVFGPTIGLAKDVSEIMYGITHDSKGDKAPISLEADDLKKLIKLLPFSNLFYLRILFNQLETNKKKSRSARRPT